MNNLTRISVGNKIRILEARLSCGLGLLRSTMMDHDMDPEAREQLKTIRQDMEYGLELVRELYAIHEDDDLQRHLNAVQADGSVSEA